MALANISEITNENARLYLAGEKPMSEPRRKTKSVAQFMIFEEIIKLDKYPLTFSEERKIANYCKTNTRYVNALATALMANGWKPKYLKELIKIKLGVVDN